MWGVYVIQHSETKQMYIGKTNDLERRLAEHNAHRHRNYINGSKKVLSLEPKVVLGAAKVSLATVYQKHSSLLTRKRMYRG